MRFYTVVYRATWYDKTAHLLHSLLLHSVGALILLDTLKPPIFQNNNKFYFFLQLATKGHPILQDAKNLEDTKFWKLAL